MSNIPIGLCQCGCGEKTQVWEKNDRHQGRVKGQYARFVKGHHGPQVYAKRQYDNGSGYILELSPGHPKATKNGYVYQHVLIAEKAFGKILPKGSVVHHANGTKNSGTLVICQDHAYHKLLHRRMRAYYACGHAHWIKCPFCKKYDEPKNLFINGKANYHKSCFATYQRKRRKPHDRHREDTKGQGVSPRYHPIITSTGRRLVYLDAKTEGKGTNEGD